MSLAVLTQVYDEMRRLAIAGSVVAGGDFRLKKLIPQLEQLGAKAPVFAKVADAAKAVVDGAEQTSANALIELTTLVNAILYTQGETGLAGDIAPLETTGVAMPVTQTSARVLKPLIEALTTTGSGRLEMIRDAHQRDAFRDLRLVKPALDAIDDPFGEIAEFIADRVLPIYGNAIVPELRARFDSKGKGGHPRRLRLLHALDPDGTRELVKGVLDDGSKEVRVVAIECLGAAPDDLSYLLEQASAKAQEVRQAAYRALAALSDDTAIAPLLKAMNGKDLDLAQDALRKSRSPKLLEQMLSAIETELAGLPKLKDKKEAGVQIERLRSLLGCLCFRDDAKSEALLLSIFERRGDFAGIKGDPASGADLNSAVVRILQRGSKRLQTRLAEKHATLTADDLADAFQAAQAALPPAQVYDMFAAYLTAKVDEKKRGRDSAWSKREVLLTTLADRYPHEYKAEAPPPLEPRWLDVAVQLGQVHLVRCLIRPGHDGANAFLRDAFQESLKKAKHLHECYDALDAMISAEHPEATDAVLAVLDKFGKESYHLGYWFGNLIPRLPKTALPRLEAVVPNLSEHVADSILGYLQQLRERA